MKLKTDSDLMRLNYLYPLDHSGQLCFAPNLTFLSWTDWKNNSADKY